MEQREDCSTAPFTATDAISGGANSCQINWLWHECEAHSGSDPYDQRSRGGDESHHDDEMACPAVEEVRWEEWEERVEEDRHTRPPSRAARAASTVELCGTKQDAEHIGK